MRKKTREGMIEAFIREHGLEVLEPGRNSEFEAWEREEARRASNARAMGLAKRGRAPKQGFWRRGEGTV